MDRERVFIDQLRMFVTAADAGSFSAAARKLNRAQSAISQAMAVLETVLGVSLFDRTERLPRITPAGAKLLSTARSIDFGVRSDKTWRLGDLGTKHALLRAGVGWGQYDGADDSDDLSSGKLAVIDLPD